MTKDEWNKVRSIQDQIDRERDLISQKPVKGTQGEMGDKNANPPPWGDDY